MLALKKRNRNGTEGRDGNGHLIKIRDVTKAYHTDAGDFIALKNINLIVEPGEFVGVIGKSGSGKSTLINMITGIDRPTEGEVFVNGTAIHRLGESPMARWRGKNMGIVFQFFQLLPTLTVVENVMLPMDLANLYSEQERRDRAMELLETVGVAEHAHKLPTAISGGQQQRVAIARSIVNDPPILVADEPTGNLDSRTSEQIIQLFEGLVSEGKTILMVTHDEDQARRVDRTVILSDGEIIDEYLARALPTLNQDLMLKATHQLETRTYTPGQPIITHGSGQNEFFVLVEGEVNVYLPHPDGGEIYVDTFRPGEYFGEMEPLWGIKSRATIRAARTNEVKVIVLDRDEFIDLMAASEATRALIEQEARRRIDTAPEETR
jgi:ABC-type lipoprotein export system ATPase subunit